MRSYHRTSTTNDIAPWDNGAHTLELAQTENAKRGESASNTLYGATAHVSILPYVTGLFNKDVRAT